MMYRGELKVKLFFLFSLLFLGCGEEYFDDHNDSSKVKVEEVKKISLENTQTIEIIDKKIKEYPEMEDLPETVEDANGAFYKSKEELFDEGNNHISHKNDIVELDSLDKNQENTLGNDVNELKNRHTPTHLDGAQ